MHKTSKKIVSLLLTTALTIATVSAAYASIPLAATVNEIPGTVKSEKNFDGSFLSVTGFAKGNILDRSNYKEGMKEYATVTNEYEFFEAITNAQKGIVKVIEIKEDLNLGWLELDDKIKEEFGGHLVEAYTGFYTASATPVANPVLIESGISCITINNIDGLTIFSKNGSTLRHSEIKFNSDVNDLAIRNLAFDEVWEWDDWRSSGFGSTGGKGNRKRTGWTFIKLNGCKNVWIDHCSFGIAFDGNIDIENGSNGITLSWCTFGDTDTSKSGMLYRTCEYLETIYQQSKKDPSVSSFIAYGIMRDNGMTMEQIMQYMGYHSKCHLVGSGDKDTWYTPLLDENGNKQYDENGLIKKIADYTKTNANERLRLTLAYNHYTNMGQRLPMIRGGVGHLYNCYIDDMSFHNITKLINSDPKNTGKTIREQIQAAGATMVLLTRGIDARNEASIGADTCVYYGCAEPIVGSEFQDDDRSNLNGAYNNFFGFNRALIVNSSVQKEENETPYIGSSWDSNGNNPFVSYKWHDRSTIGNFNWGQEGNKLPYDYQTFPLEDVKNTTTLYSGCGKLELSGEDWLRTDYPTDFQVKTTSNIPSIESFTLNKSEADVYIDNSEFLQLTEQFYPSNVNRKETISWTSSNPSVATVSESGLVTPHSYGTTTITATTTDNKSATCEVSVKKLIKTININVPEKVYVGEEFYLSANILPDDAADKSLIWSVSGGRLELLDSESGLVRALSAGSSTVYAKPALTGNRIGIKPLTAKATIKITSPDFKPGDVNLDENIDLSDALLSLKAALGIEELNNIAFKAADIDNDGNLTLSDTLIILKMALGIIS